MSDETTKVKHSKRLHNTRCVIKKRKKLVKAYGIPKDYDTEGHRLSKMNGINCGDPTCIMCMNPRRSYKEKTIQEKSFEQTVNWED